MNRVSGLKKITLPSEMSVEQFNANDTDQPGLLKFNHLSVVADLGGGGIKYINRQTSRSPRPTYMPTCKPILTKSKSPNLKNTSRSKKRKIRINSSERDNCGSTHSPMYEQKRVIFSR